MVLQPLEFTDCFLDSPWFRSGIKEHEDELEKTNTQIKLLIKDAKSMLLSFRKQCDTMHTFSERLKNFQFEIIGINFTDAEKGIAGFLKEFGSLLEEIEGEWSKTIERSELQLIDPLERFRKDHIHSYREAKKTFEKSSDRYYKQLEQTLSLSHKKKDQQLKESDDELVGQRRNFHESSLEYIYKLQEVQERKKFEFVEHLLMFMQKSLVSTRSQYEGTRDKTRKLMQKMMENPSHDVGTDSVQPLVGRRWTRAGYLYLLEKNPLGARFSSKWTRFFCMYTKENKLFQMTSPLGSTSFSSSTSSTRLNHSHIPVIAEPLIVSLCTRRATESIDKRFCFDIEVKDTAGKTSVLTLQAASLNDRKKWIAAMDGKEPAYILSQDYKKSTEFVLNDVGIEFVQTIIAEIERRGVDTEGIYRLVGVSSRVDKLMQLMMDPKSSSQVNYRDEVEWEMTTLTSALKNFFRNLPEPIMTFELHDHLIEAAKQEDPDQRLKKILDLVSKLSPNSKKVLGALLAHLVKVASKSHLNKMPVQNIGVCFGPTLMRPKQETVQSIMEIKFNNIIVEMLIDNYEAIFVHGSVKEVVEKHQQVRPSVDSRPSMRMKTRPARTAISQYENVPGERVIGNASRPSSDNSPKFQRGHAIRAIPKRRASPNFPERGEKEDDSMSDNTSDELGRMSPLDLNLSLDFPPGQASKLYMNSQQSSSVRNKPAKENLDIRRVHSQKSTPDHLRDTENSSKNENYNNSRDLKHDLKSPSQQKAKLLQPAPKRQPPNVLPKTSVIRKGVDPLQKKSGTYIVKAKVPVSSPGSESESKQHIYSKPIKREQLVAKKQFSPQKHDGTSSNDPPGSKETRITQQHNTMTRKPSDSRSSNRVFVALYSCEAEHESELSFEPGDIIHDVMESDEPGWLIGMLDEVRGLIPANYVREEYSE